MPSSTWPLTRRGFLEQFGLVGGSALVMSAMRSWELMAAQAGPRPVLAGNPDGTRVLVLGAGISGLVAAYELRKLGYNVRVLEARDRVGGVNVSVRRGDRHGEVGPGGETQVCRFDDGLYFNGGPWRLPHWHTGVLGYCRELGVPLETLIYENESSYFYYEGENIGPLAGRRVRLREVKADMIGYTCELMAKAVSQDALDLPLTAEDKERFISFLMPYSMGGFAFGAGAADRQAALGTPDGRIFLACAAVSGNGAWQEGAVAAAWKQVRQLHERVMARRV
jgi:monoamine oxidase